MLLRRNLIYFWRTNLAVIAGVAVAVAVLAGALLVGDSVRASLRRLFLARIGATEQVITTTGFFRDNLAEELQSEPSFKERFANACPLIALPGSVKDENSGRGAHAVQVYAVDDRFWRFHGASSPDTSAGSAPDDAILISSDLARELGSAKDHSIVLRIEKPSAIPAGSVHGRKDTPGRAIRFRASDPLSSDSIGEFSLRPQQGEVRSVFVALSRLQRDLELTGKANLLLLSSSRRTPADDVATADADRALIEKSLRDNFGLEDLGTRIRVLDDKRGIALEKSSAIINDSLMERARKASQSAGVAVVPILSYLANSISTGNREVPYSLVTAIDDGPFQELSRNYARVEEENKRDPSSGDRSATESRPNGELPPILLNEWAANDLGVKPGDEIDLEYYFWQDEGTLTTQTSRFRLTGVVPMTDPLVDRDLVPDYPGITETESISDWDPPFPVDLDRVRPRDEDYWHKYRTTPKAFIQLEKGVELWQTRYGKYTSLRIQDPARRPESYLGSFSKELREALDPLDSGLSVHAVRAEGMAASSGATDFGQYFVYFSFFLVVAALLLASLFFKLGIEQRLREIGLLRAVGFPPAEVRSLFLREGLVLASVGSLLGVGGAIGYAALMMYGLSTWWVGAVGTTSLSLNVTPVSLAIGAVGGIAAALLCVAWTLRGLAPASPAVMLAGNLEAAAAKCTGGGKARARIKHNLIAVALTVLGVLFLVAGLAGLIGETSGFFASGAALLAALLCWQYRWLSRQARRAIGGKGWQSVSLLGFRNAAYRPGRSILCIALIASAAFIIVAVDSFRKGSDLDHSDRRSGTGGYALLAESVVSLYHDPNTVEGRDELSLFQQGDFDPAAVSFTRFRVRKGDDSSCLNLYQPRDPRILAPEPGFVSEGRFAFQSSLAQTADEQANPWLLLNGELPNAEIPVVADANSLTYVLHRKVGDIVTVNSPSAGTVRLRIVGALSDTIFQSELLMSEANFLRLFPETGGYSFFLLDVPTSSRELTASALEEQLSDFGFDVAGTSDRLAAFHRIENTYISTFQALGGLGLVLGTLGLAAILLRNVIERRKELALLRAVGYRSSHFASMVVVENAFLVLCGLVTGAICALVAIMPALRARGGQLPTVSLGLLGLVLLTGLVASIAASVASARAPLIPALRSE